MQPKATSPPTPAPSSAPRKGSALAVIVVAVLVVAAFGILFLVAFVLGPLTAIPAPVVDLSVAQPVSSSGAATIKVVDASRALGPSYFRVNISTDDMDGAPQPMPPKGERSVFPMGANVFSVEWGDTDNSTTLTAGDTFYVSPEGGSFPDAGSHVRFWLLGSNDGTTATVAWIVPGFKPVVTFGSLAVTSQLVSFQVAGATPVVAINSYKFNLQTPGGAGALAIALAPGANSITAGGIDYWVNYTDVSGNQNLKSGDVIKVEPKAGAPFTAGTYAFLLLWAADGSLVQSQTWNM